MAQKGEKNEGSSRIARMKHGLRGRLFRQYQVMKKDYVIDDSLEKHQLRLEKNSID